MKKIISAVIAFCLIFSFVVNAYAINLGAFDDSYVFDYENYITNLKK